MATELRSALVSDGWRVEVPADAARTTAAAASVLEQLRAQARLHLRSRRRDQVVTHALYYDIPSWGAAPLVVTVHDMIHERFGIGSRRLRVAKRRAVRVADAVVCDSDHTRRDLVANGLDPTRASVVPLGVSSAITDGAGVADPFDGQPYLLYVGDRAGYKNFGLLVEALSSEPELDGFGLVIVGGPPVPADELDEIRQRRRGAAVEHRSSVDDRELGNLYRGAAALVVTSRYEGFGLSVLEALACGCAVASSRCGSLSEFDSGLSYAFDPDSIIDCATAVIDAAHADDARRRFGVEHASTFTWQTTAERYAALYHSLHVN